MRGALLRSVRVCVYGGTPITVLWQIVFSFATMSKQCSLASFGFLNASNTVPPPATPSLVSTAALCEPAASPSTFNFSDLVPPYDIGLVYNCVSQLSDLER